MHFAVQKDVFLTIKYGKTRWRPGLRPGTRWGSLRRSPIPPSRLGRGHPSSDPTPLSASILAPSALNFDVPIVVNLRNDHCHRLVAKCVIRWRHETTGVPSILQSSFPVSELWFFRDHDLSWKSFNNIGSKSYVRNIQQPTFLPSRYFKEHLTFTSAILFTFDRMSNALTNAHARWLTR